MAWRIWYCIFCAPLSLSLSFSVTSGEEIGQGKAQSWPLSPFLPIRRRLAKKDLWLGTVVLSFSLSHSISFPLSLLSLSSLSLSLSFSSSLLPDPNRPTPWCACVTRPVRREREEGRRPLFRNYIGRSRGDTFRGRPNGPWQKTDRAGNSNRNAHILRMQRLQNAISRPPPLLCQLCHLTNCVSV